MRKLGKLTRLADLLPEFKTLEAMNEHFRQQQQWTRPDETLRMKTDARSKLQAKADDETERPAFVPDEIERHLIKRMAPIRPGILACITEPEGKSFCDGSGHTKSFWSSFYRRWEWQCFELCPVSVAESRIGKEEKQEGVEGSGGKFSGTKRRKR